MSDLNIQLALDYLCTAVEGVTPRVAPEFPFQRHQDRNITLDKYDDALGFRKFEWVDVSVGGVQTANVLPQANASEAWYEFDLELQIFYPKAYWVENDETLRGIVGIRLSDIIDLNKVLMFGNPFAGASFDYELLQLHQKTSRQGNILTIPYRVALTESLA